MKHHTNILVAFDGSENGLKALDTAKDFIGNSGRPLTILYVDDSPSFEHPVGVTLTRSGEEYMFHPYSEIDSRGIERQRRINVKEEMSNKVRSIAGAKFTDIPNVTFKELSGIPSREIVNYASKHDKDLIIIGNRGIGAFRKLVMGSVSNKVTNDAECSVFVVK